MHYRYLSYTRVLEDLTMRYVTVKEKRRLGGDVLIMVLLERKTYAILYVGFGDPECNSDNKYPTRSLLSWWENGGKDKYSNHCHRKRKHASSFVLSDEGML